MRNINMTDKNNSTNGIKQDHLTGNNGRENSVTGAGVNINPSYLLNKLNQFLTLATSYVGNERWNISNYGGRNERFDRTSVQNEEDEQAAAKLALFLLRNLPPARQAALSFLSHILSKEASILILYKVSIFKK